LPNDEQRSIFNDEIITLRGAIHGIKDLLNRPDVAHDTLYHRLEKALGEAEEIEGRLSSYETKQDFVYMRDL
jgi:hypothetical protein